MGGAPRSGLRSAGVPPACLILLLAAGAAGAAEPPDPDFDEDVPIPSIALGPVERGRPFVAADVGWLRSGLRFHLGLGAGLDLFLSTDAMLLYQGLSGQNGIHAGLRFTWTEGFFRTAVEASAGKVFQPLDAGLQAVTTVSGAVTAGAVLDLVTVYGRAELRGMGGEDLPARPDFQREVELGLGVERGFRRLVLGAEVFVLSRPGHGGLGEWRLRAGMAL